MKNYFQQHLDHLNLKSTAINVAVTFVQGFIAAWALTNNTVSKHAVLGAGAAAGSLVWNTVIKPQLKLNKILYK